MQKGDSKTQPLEYQTSYGAKVPNLQIKAKMKSTERTHGLDKLREKDDRPIQITHDLITWNVCEEEESNLSCRIS